MAVCCSTRSFFDFLLSVHIFPSHKPFFAEKGGDIGRDALVGEKMFLIKFGGHIKPIDSHRCTAESGFEICAHRGGLAVDLRKFLVAVIYQAC